MECIKKEELIEGEIYVFDNKFINKIQNGHLNIKCWISIPGEYFYKKSSNNQTNNIINATSEEKHWLNTCIKQDKFITFEEAMKTFIPEYVEWVDNIGSNNLGYQTSYHFKKNKIFKTDVELPSHGFQTQNWIKHLEIYANNYKPSTKEAYDAQFVVIEPLPQFKIIETIETIETITKVENNEGNQFFIGDTVIGSKTKIKSKIISFKYNVDKTAILAITDKTPNIGIGINHLEHYIEPKVEVKETLLEKAKRLYPVGTKFINPNDNRECVIKEKGNYFEGNNHNIYHSIANRVFKYEEGFSGCIYINNTWSKIIE